jgi:hypothetical protein
LRERREEIVGIAVARIFAISESAEEGDLRYSEGLRAAVEAAVDYGLAVIEGRPDAGVPVALLAQARLAARNGVSLDTILRRYFAGYSLLEQVVREEARDELGANLPALQRVAGAKAPAFERLIADITREYRDELATAPDPSPERRRFARIRRLLSGELVESFDLDYDLDQQHLGVIAEGPGALAVLRGLAREMDWGLLTAVEEGTIWAWLGTRRRHDSARLGQLRRREWPEGLVLALGEPGEGLAGWRRSHLQAKAALTVARASIGFARYREVALAAAALQNELVAASLKELFVDPLKQEGDAVDLCETLDAYLAADRNVSSAAAALGVSRHTVTSRIRTIEGRLGHPIHSCGSGITVALQLRHLTSTD